MLEKKQKGRMKMEFHSIDIPEMEKQRYQAIKRTGEYIELNILIGTEEDDKENGISTKQPVVTTCMHKCGPKEVACLYATLNAVSKMLKEKYPLECLLSEIGMKIENLGSIDSSLNEDEED